MPAQIKQSDKIPSSFRDPSGFLFHYDGVIYRQINRIYKDNYDHLMSSGLYSALTASELIVPHIEVDFKIQDLNGTYKIIKPEIIPFISYPYEWCFSQLKQAALVNLQIQKIALDYGMSLKDSSAYNIQFRKGKPVLIDTLSFEKYREGEPWVAYRQFCQHFLGPLALMSYTDVRLNQLLRIYIDGIPVDLTSILLPFKTWLNFSLLSNIHLHAATQKKYEDKPVRAANKKMSRIGLQAIIDNLESTVKKLQWKPQGTEWGEYYSDTNYTEEAGNHKKQFIIECLELINPKNVWDMGANTGLYSRLASDRGIPTISFDIDPAAIEKNYLTCVKNKEQNMLPLLLDLTNPSPSIGWGNTERMSMLQRGPADMIFALALIHHLAISNNVPLNKIVELFSKLCNFLIIEFVPKSDSQVQRLLATREDIFTDYTQQFFEDEFKEYFTINRFAKIKDSERVLYLFQRKV
ncbi:hypothetical protein L9W92_01070 [Pelotomaculum terephthalicicum JT]|uniref:hypothetical protein n=1 Tax=Pelotomaculum terephthalicicum TaxID=206393 RepID=UPI001F04A21C|nr:hypothetical protein [Pelotomaculum terephthalicicum]MCG9966647.1 hypothetical protein [Pelotomaculum terephthalicicum JT]